MIKASQLATILMSFVALFLVGCRDGDSGEQGLQGIQGLQGLQGEQGPEGPGSVGTVYVIPGSGGVSGGGYLQLNTVNDRASLSISCNYGFEGDNEAYWFAEAQDVVAGDIMIVNQLDGQPLQVFNDLEYNQGGQDRAEVDGSAQLGDWPWHGVFTANDGGTLTRWDVTIDGSSGGDCTAIVYANNGGTVSVRHPQ